MADDLGTFKAVVEDEVNRGTIHAAAIAQRIAMAGRWLERNYSLRYMHRWVSFILEAAGIEPRLINPPKRVRNYEFFRLTLDNGTLHYLDKVDAADVLEIASDIPNRFWLDGDKNIVLDKPPNQDYPAEIGYQQFTDWNSMLDTDVHWLFEQADDALLGQTMMLMAPYLRETERFIVLYKVMRDEALHTLITADEALQHGAAESVNLEYHGN